MNKSAEDARKDARLWASRSEGDDDVYAPDLDSEFAWQGSYQPEPAVVQTLLGNVLRRQTTDQRSITKDCSVLGKLLRTIDANPPREDDDGMLVPGLPVSGPLGEQTVGLRLTQKDVTEREEWIRFSYSNEDNEYGEGKGEETRCDR
jgi:hypothetical protein